jgi:hypothetical protein
MKHKLTRNKTIISSLQNQLTNSFNKKFNLVFLFLIVINFNSFSQEEVEKRTPKATSNVESVKGVDNERDQLHKLMVEMEGSFQFQISKPDYSPVVSLELLDRIQKSRLENENSTIVLDQYITILIVSKSKMESSGFQKLENIIYVNK